MAPVPRIVVDTNILVASAYAPQSSSRKILDAILNKQFEACLSEALRNEYLFIIGRAVRIKSYLPRLEAFLDQAAVVEPENVPRVVPEDPEDDKLIAVGLASGAVALITNDQHVLQLDPQGDLRIVRPGAFLREWLTDSEAD